MQTVHVREHPDIDYIFRYKPPRPTSRILDCGCGQGGRVLAISMRGHRTVIGVDASPANIAIARERARNHALGVQFVESKLWSTPFPDRSFDEILLLNDVIGHGTSARGDLELLVEVRRLLAPNGMLWLSIADGDWLREHHERQKAESVRRGLAYSGSSLTENGRCLQTRFTIVDSETAASNEETLKEWLYNQQQMTALLHLLGFEAISHHASYLPPLPDRIFGMGAPRLLINCLAPRRLRR